MPGDEILRADGPFTRALDLHQAAADTAERLGRPAVHAAALTELGRVLAMNRELNKPDDQAISLEGLGECHLSAGQTEPGAVHLREALEIYHRLGMDPAAERIHARLAATTGSPAALPQTPRVGDQGAAEAHPAGACLSGDRYIGPAMWR